MHSLLADIARCLNAEDFPNAVDITVQAYTPFHVVSLIIFLCAIVHTLCANFFSNIAHRIEKYHETQVENGAESSPKSFWAEIFHFLGEVEVVFGIWVVPLFFLIVAFYNWDTALFYIDSRTYIEPIFVVIIMCAAGTRPIVELAERVLDKVAGLFGGRPLHWWFTILTFGPLLGSFITEAGAMTLSAIMLSHKFYECKPSSRLAYATIGLLFVNVSVGGILTNFAAPPVLIISHCWNLTTPFMFTHFGWKAITGIVVSNFVYYFAFFRELHAMNAIKVRSRKKAPVPLWITVVHIAFIIWTVSFQHDTPVFLGSFLLFLGFYQATAYHQYQLQLRRPVLVGFFLAGLVIHGGLQGWWIVPLLSRLTEGVLMSVSIVLTAFNDNAAVTYLASLIPDLTTPMKRAIISGVVVGGGLTVIANAPNPAGQMLLRKHFRYGISPLKLFASALVPTLIMFVVFYFTL